MATISPTPTKVPVNQSLRFNTPAPAPGVFPPAPPVPGSRSPTPPVVPPAAPAAAAPPAAPSPAPAPGSFPPLPPPPPNKLLGRFGQFVPLIDPLVAQILNELDQLLGVWGRETANFAFAELSRGSLRGIVRASKASVIVDREPDIDLKAEMTAAAGDAQSTNALHQGLDDGSGVVFFADTTLNKAASAGTDRNMAKLVLCHELTHHRNNANYVADVNIGFQGENTSKRATDKNGALSPLQTIYVHPLLARSFPKSGTGTASFQARGLYIAECIARHVAWNVSHELSGNTPPSLLPGQLYHQLIRRAGFFRDYSDSGYMDELNRNTPDLFRQQVAQWMGNVATKLFHGNATVNGSVQTAHARDITLAQSTNFALPTVLPDGHA